MLAGIGRALVHDLAAIDPVSEKVVQRAALEGLPAIGRGVRSPTLLADDARSIELSL